MSTSARPAFSYDGLKRLLDVVAASSGLIVLSPVLAVVAALVGAKLGRPILFRQDRPGKNGRVFRLYKFRTMKGVDLSVGLATDDERLSSFGRTLRSTSLDELPALINVLKGDMSVVGPRPLLVRYLDRYTPRQARRHDVRPGITGLAQVNGRNSLDWDEKFALDVEYVENRSLALDTKVLWHTIAAVLRREGVNAQGEATMTEFVGSARPEFQSDAKNIIENKNSSERR
jgi:lipopolysaccharide/colanic/teichoic acid biosynthesis glycosyltransferase